MGLADRLDGKFRRRDVEEDIGLGRGEVDDLRIDSGIGDFVAHFADHDRRGRGPQAIAEAFEEILAEIVVLVEHGDLGILHLLQHVGGVDAGLRLIDRRQRHGVGEVLGIVPAAGAGRQEELRYLPGVEVLLDRRVGRRAERAGDGEHLVLLDQAARLLDRLGRAEAVVERDHGDLAASHAALVVDHLEVGDLGLGQGDETRQRSAIRHGLAELDFGVAGARIVLLLCRGWPREHHHRQQRRCRHADARHGSLPVLSASMPPRDQRIDCKGGNDGAREL